MQTYNVKRIAAYLEIFIYVSIGLYIVQNKLTQYYIEDIKTNFNDNRQNPIAIFFSGFLGQSPSNVFNGIIGQKVTALFQDFLSFLTPVFKIFTDIFSQFQNQINGIRSILNPIRDFFQKATEVFYKSIQNFTIGIMYSLHKIRNTMKRTLSGFNLIYHSLEHTKNTFESIANSTPVKIAEQIMPSLDWVVGKAGSLGFCFDANTIINCSNSPKNIANINVGDTLSPTNVVIAKHQFINSDKLYNYNGIYVSGSHIVLENNKWIRVDKSTSAILTNHAPQYVYSLSTSDSIININSIIFKDYSESNDMYTNYSINYNILCYLNNYIPNQSSTFDTSIYSSPSIYLDQGFANNTKVVMKNNKLTNIEDIVIGDLVKSKYTHHNTVLGIVELDPNRFTFYTYDGVSVSSNMKVFENYRWISVEYSDNFKITSRPRKAYHIITSDGDLYISNDNKYQAIYRDYLEHHDDTTYSVIENIVLQRP